MIIKIVCAGNNDFKNLYEESAEEVLVGVDAGAMEIIKLNKQVDLAIGDFDSSNLEDIVMESKNIRVYPKEKDLGDLELAINEIKDIENERIEIYNATGGRLDHYQATINILAKFPDLNLELIDRKNRIRIINKSTKLEKGKYKYVSMFAVDEGLRITLTGFKFSLNNYLLNRLNNLVLSNEIVDEVGHIKLNNKRLLLIESK